MLRTSPRTPEAIAAEERGAERAKEAWGCKGGKPPSPHLKLLGESFWRAVGPGTPCEGCPFAGVYHPADGWTREVFDAMALTSTGDGGTGLPWDDALGRDVTAADREAILAVQGARAVMLRAERVEREARKGEKE